MIIDNNTVLKNSVLEIYLKVAKRVYLKCSHTKKEIIMWGDGGIN